MGYHHPLLQLDREGEIIAEQYSDEQAELGDAS
jgi:hypothetical protein